MQSDNFDDDLARLFAETEIDNDVSVEQIKNLQARHDCDDLDVIVPDEPEKSKPQVESLPRSDNPLSHFARE